MNAWPSPRPCAASVTIARPPRDVYLFWRNLGNAPSFMADIESLEIIDDRRSRWSAREPGGPVVSWEVVIDEDRPGERLSLALDRGRGRAHRRASSPSRPRRGGAGPRCACRLRYGPADGAAARGASFLWNAAASHRIEADLRRFKQLLETGHVVPASAVARGDLA